ncbi:hypothetical protein FRC02_002252 [Tulasnella sp. 418]|nr:hypothetical protein FRC02_002252 [Tulasnella sp. 418]
MRKPPAPKSAQFWVEVPAMPPKGGPDQHKPSFTKSRLYSPRKTRSATTSRAKNIATGDTFIEQKRRKGSNGTKAASKAPSDDSGLSSSDESFIPVFAKPATRSARNKANPITTHSESPAKNEFSRLEAREVSLRQREIRLAKRERELAKLVNTQECTLIAIEDEKKTVEEMKQRAQELLKAAQTASKAVEGDILRSSYEEQEDTLQCPICMLVMASPYLITTSNCEHTLCGQCALRIYFSQMCASCHVFHQDLPPPTCPTCRQPIACIVKEPSAMARPPPPFIFNRIVSNLVDIHVQKMRALGVKEWLDDGEYYQAWVLGSGVPHQIMQRLINGWSTMAYAEFWPMKLELDSFVS